MTGLVGVLTPLVGRWWFGEVVSGLEAVLRPAGYDMLLYPVPDTQARAAFFASLAERVRFDGIVVVSLPLTAAEIAQLRATQRAVGCVGTLLPGVLSVTFDEKAAAQEVTDHLLDLGHRRIALIGGDPHEPQGFTSARQRRLGFRFAMNDRGLDTDPAADVPGYWTVRGGAAAARRLLALREPPTAIFALSDEMAVGALSELAAGGVRVPGEVSVAGFDNHPDAEHFGLTTLEQPAHDDAVRLASALVGRMERGGSAAHPEHVVNPFRRLHVRRSTGPAPE